ncbi:S1/P1 nuclease [Chitinimonas naiadis]
MKFPYRPYALALSAILGLAAMPAQAWHDEGHRIVARVADRFLTDKTRAELRRILGSNDVPGSLATAAIYLDDHKPMLASQQPGSPTWHYDDLEICGEQRTNAFCKDGACASGAISRHIAMLADPVNHDGIKLQALRYVSHIIGDIQQPLHASDNHDQGGNAIRLNPVFESYGFYDNLHSLWDGYWVKKAMRVSKLKEADFADMLATRYQAKATEWSSGNVQDWIQESHKLAETVTYGKLPDWSCGAAPSKEKLTLDKDYLTVGDELVPEQLFKGGVRLASVLNAALGK